MNAARIVNFLLEGDLTPEEFLGSLPRHILHRFDFADDTGPANAALGRERLRVYITGPHGKGFIGYIHKMGGFWYAYRLRDFKHIEDAPLRNTEEEAAQDLYDAEMATDRLNQ